MRFDVDTTSVQSNSTAIIAVDLANAADANDLVFEFWTKRLNSSTASDFYMRVDVSGDGSSWTLLSSKLQPEGNVWVNHSYDLDASLGTAGITSDGFFVRLRQFGSQPVHESIVDGVRLFRSGDVDAAGAVESASTMLTLSATTTTVNEAVGPDATIVTVMRDGDLSSSLVVELTSTDESAFTTPESVVFLPGESEASFGITTHNDFDIDATQSADVIATAGALSGSLTIQVENDDTIADRTLGGVFSGILPTDIYTVTRSAAKCSLRYRCIRT